jgi:hypothetical protein
VNLLTQATGLTTFSIFCHKVELDGGIRNNAMKRKRWARTKRRRTKKSQMSPSPKLDLNY